MYFRTWSQTDSPHPVILACIISYSFNNVWFAILYLFISIYIYPQILSSNILLPFFLYTEKEKEYISTFNIVSLRKNSFKDWIQHNKKFGKCFGKQCLQNWFKIQLPLIKYTFQTNYLKFVFHNIENHKMCKK